MKTILSLTSRRFAMTRVRVFFEGRNLGSIGEKDGSNLGSVRSGEGVEKVKLGVQRSLRTLVIALGTTLAGVGANAQEAPVKSTISPSTSATQGENESLPPIMGLKESDKLRVSIPDLTAWLVSVNPPKTVPAIEFLKGLTPEIRKYLLGSTGPQNPFDIAYAEINKEGDPAPTLEEFQSYLLEEYGKPLARSISEVLGREIQPKDLVELSRVELDKLEEKNPDIYDKFDIYRPNLRRLKLALSQIQLANAKQETANAKQETANAKRRLESAYEESDRLDQITQGMRMTLARLTSALN